MKASKFTSVAVILVILAVSGWASDKMKANIQIYETVNVGSTQLMPGDYKMTWTESGSNAKVTFAQSGKTIATVPAQITQERSVFNGPALFTDKDSNTLTGIQLSKVLLSFTGKEAPPAKSGN